jgi:chemotaxis protein CheD
VNGQKIEVENVHLVPTGGIIASGVAKDVLVAYGLSSCVAICLYDPMARVGGMLHAMLPTNPYQNGHDKGHSANPVKYVDQGTPLLIESLLKLGARRSRLVAQLCGGARTLFAPNSKSDPLNIGQRNVLAAESALRAEGLRILAQDTGGDMERTVKFYISTGLVTVENPKRSRWVLNGKHGNR